MTPLFKINDKLPQYYGIFRSRHNKSLILTYNLLRLIAFNSNDLKKEKENKLIPYNWNCES